MILGKESCNCFGVLDVLAFEDLVIAFAFNAKVFAVDFVFSAFPSPACFLVPKFYHSLQRMRAARIVLINMTCRVLSCHVLYR